MCHQSGCVAFQLGEVITPHVPRCAHAAASIKRPVHLLQGNVQDIKGHLAVTVCGRAKTLCAQQLCTSKQNSTKHCNHVACCTHTPVGCKIVHSCKYSQHASKGSGPQSRRPTGVGAGCSITSHCGPHKGQCAASHESPAAGVEYIFSHCTFRCSMTHVEPQTQPASTSLQLSSSESCLGPCL